MKWLIGSLIALMLVNNVDTVRAETRPGDTTKLVDAIKNQDRAAVRALLDQRVEVNAAERDGTTALHWAVYMDDLATAELLIRAEANVKVSNRHGVTPLSLAALNGNASMLDMLLSAGADPNTALLEGETALMTAARTGKVEALKVLLAHGANVNAKESTRGQTALMWAAAEGHTAVVQALTERGADIPARSTGGLTALLFAVREGKIDAVRALLRAGADVNETITRSPSITRTSIAGYALGQRPQGATSALVLAVGSAHYELASVLLDAGADPNAAAQGWTALHQVTWVRRSGQGDNNPAPQGSGNMDSLGLVARLVAHGANVNARMTAKADMGTTEVNNIGATPLLLTARTTDIELMRLLIKLGADPLLPNEDNTTPLMAAAGVGTYSPGEDPGTESEGLEAVKLLWESGGDVNTVNKAGDTAMHGAAYKFFPSVVRFLAEKGARIDIWNQKNKLGFTPLVIAEGVQRAPSGTGDHIRTSTETAAAVREAMTGAPGQGK
ncbi:MAG TPA: ankyrin repeat domain-containing protein [Terriglobia bacterium]|nr:ankyrin repeat domain-containing protein [Terriglobia bacterium]